MGMSKSQLAVVITGSNRGAVNALTGLDAQLGKVGLSLARLMAVGAAAATGAVVMIRSWANAGDEIDKLSKKTGFSAEALSELKYAAELSGTSISDIAVASKTLSSAIVDANAGLATYTRAFDLIGLSAKELIGLKPEEQFMRVVAALAGLDDETVKVAAAQDLFGRSGSNMLPLLAEGADGLRRMRDEARSTGSVFSTEAATKAAALNDSLTKLGGTITGIKNEMASGLAGEVFKVYIDSFQTFIGELSGANARAQQSYMQGRTAYEMAGGDEGFKAAKRAEVQAGWEKEKAKAIELSAKATEAQNIVQAEANKLMAGMENHLEALLPLYQKGKIQKVLDTAASYEQSDAIKAITDAIAENKRKMEATASAWQDYYNAKQRAADIEHHEANEAATATNTWGGMSFTGTGENIAAVGVARYYAEHPERAPGAQSVQLDGREVARIIDRRLGSRALSRRRLGG
jgi:hypothetical protein